MTIESEQEKFLQEMASRTGRANMCKNNKLENLTQVPVSPATRKITETLKK
jgi:hypothetical protein